MDLYGKLPVELQRKVFQYLRHPLADLIQNLIVDLHLDNTFIIKDINNKVIVEICCKDYLIREYFYKRDQGQATEIGSPLSDTSSDFLSEMIFEDLGELIDD